MDQSMPTKLCTLTELAALIPDGASIAVSGVFLHRGPFALMRELVRQGRRGLEFIKSSPGYDFAPALRQETMVTTCACSDCSAMSCA